MINFINPITFHQTKIDESTLTAEQVDLLKRMSRTTKKINRLQQEQWLAMFKIEESTKMKFSDVLKRITIK